ncbi:MAG: hypothetical protein Q9P44_14035 [Anaerolineae bacterium]|nr:hypothetical protein [Anaerolineae bacterium]
MGDDVTILTDHEGRNIRLTSERREHILEHPEMAQQFERIAETVKSPETIIATTADDTVHVYHRYYETTPVTSKFLLVTVKRLEAPVGVSSRFTQNDDAG